MKIIFIIIFMFASSLSMADESECKNPQNNSLTQEQIAERGCCSHHGGVCGCSGGTDICCDGAASPSCGCHAEDLLQKKVEDSDKPQS